MADHRLTAGVAWSRFAASRRRVIAALAGVAFALTGVPVRRGVVTAQTACTERLFPADNVWNVPIADLPLDPNSAA